MAMTIAEKILAKASGRKQVTAGDVIHANVDVAVFHDVGVYLINYFKEAGVKKVWDPDKIVVVFDHYIPAHDVKTAENQRKIREFVRKQGIKYFYDVGEQAISHQLICEKGHARPGILLASVDTYAVMAGALGAFSTAHGFDLLYVLATGENWYKVPGSVKFNLSGTFQEGVMSRDFIQWLIKELGPDCACYKAVEFIGPSVEAMSIDSRLSLCHYTVKLGAKTALINPDQKTVNYVKARAKEPFQVIKSDLNATYEEVFEYDIFKIEPQLATPGDPGNTASVVEEEGTEIDQAFIGTCAAGRLEDLRVAARILKGRKVHPKVRLVIAPASSEIYLNAVREGLAEIFVEAGVIFHHPSCALCVGRIGALAPREVCISTSTNNLPGRMGNIEAKVYLANAATVAASAVNGKITDPRKFL